MSDLKPYTVIVDNEGCHHCGNAKSWVVIDPFGNRTDYIWTDEDDAKWMAEMLNDAVDLGRKNTIAAKRMSREVGMESLINDLFKSVEVGKALKEKTNHELAQLLKEHIWGESDILDPKSSLIEEVIDRLESHTPAPAEVEWKDKPDGEGKYTVQADVEICDYKSKYGLELCEPPWSCSDGDYYVRDMIVKWRKKGE